MQKVRDPTVAVGKGKGKKGQGKEASLGGGDLCLELMNILMVVRSGIRNLKV